MGQMSLHAEHEPDPLLNGLAMSTRIWPEPV